MNNANKWQMGFNSAFKGLISVCTQFHIPICYPHLAVSYLFPLSRLIPLSLTVPRPQLGFLAVSLFTVTGCRPVAQPPQPGGPVHSIYNPWGRVVQLYSQAPGTHFCCLLQPVWAPVGLFFPQSHGESLKLCVTFILPWHSNFHLKKKLLVQLILNFCCFLCWAISKR